MNYLRTLFTDNWHFNVFYALLLLAVSTLPLTTFLMLPIALLMLLNMIVEWNWKQKWQNVKQQQAVPALFFFLSVFLIPIIGFFFSYNKSHALSAFDCNLWFLIAPVVFLTYPREYMTVKRIRAALKWFSIATIVHAFILLSVASYKLLKFGDDSSFYYIKLSFLRHPSYVAMYSTFTFFILLYFIHNYKKHLSRATWFFLVFALIILMTLVVLLQSKSGILVFGILMLIWACYLIYHAKYKILWSALFLVVVLGTGWVVFKTDLLPVNRLQETVTQVKNHKKNPYGHGSSEIRLTVWQSSWELAKKNLPWGVGTGDVDNELCLNAVKKNYTNLIGHHFNAHNQYLQTLLAVGIPGLIILLCYCLYPLWFSIKSKDILFFSFGVILIFNILVESMFEVRAGVDFFAILNVLLWQLTSLKTTNLTNNS